jgi:hypothetical protein
MCQVMWRIHFRDFSFDRLRRRTPRPPAALSREKVGCALKDFDTHRYVGVRFHMTTRKAKKIDPYDVLRVDPAATLDDWGLSVLNPPERRDLLENRYQPDPRRTLARHHRRPHPRRRHPGSPRSQRSPPSTLRRTHAKTERPQSNS